MNLPKRYLEVLCIPKHSDSRPLGIIDTKESSLVVFSENGFATWSKEEVKDSFLKLINPNDGMAYDLSKVLK